MWGLARALGVEGRIESIQLLDQKIAHVFAIVLNCVVRIDIADSN